MPPPSAASATLTLRPIGVVHSPFRDRLSAPRQPRAAGGALGTLELFKGNGIEHALEDLASFRFIWVLFWFHANEGFKPKVLPPRSSKRRGVFATRAPYRPNPIGMSAVELLRVEGLKLSVRNLDMLDQTPILDLKPYVPYVDAIFEANSGWLDTEVTAAARAPAAPADPLPDFQVEFAPLALEQLDFLLQHGESIRAGVEDVLRLGAQPHGYRRMKPKGDGWVLAYKAWRLDFSISGPSVCVTRIMTGYRPDSLANGKEPVLELHRAFVSRFG